MELGEPKQETLCCASYCFFNFDERNHLAIMDAESDDDDDSSVSSADDEDEEFDDSREVRACNKSLWALPRIRGAP